MLGISEGTKVGLVTSFLSSFDATRPRWIAFYSTASCIDPPLLQRLSEARHRGREKNLQLRQPTLPLENQEVVANSSPKQSHCG
jgi:hypothetical protein